MRAVSEITPFRKSAIFITEGDGRFAVRAAVHGTGDLPERVPASELVRAFDRGFKLDLASFVPGPLIAGQQASPRPAYSEARARRHATEPGDHGLVEIRSPHRLWGYILFEDPDDHQRPSEDSMRLLSLLSGYVATVLENRDSYDAEARLRSRLEMVRDVVHLALQRADLGAARSVMTAAAVTRAGYAFSAFLERNRDGLWSIEAPCPSLQGARAPSLMNDVLELQMAEARPGEALHLPRQSFILGHAPRFSCAIPVFSGSEFRGYFVIEDDSRGAIEDADEAAFLTLCDQMGLLIRRLDYEQELARKNAEVETSYTKLQAIHAENLRMQDVLRRYVPPSTWDKIDKGGAGRPGGNRRGGRSGGHVRGHLRLHPRLRGAQTPADRGHAQFILHRGGRHLLPARRRDRQVHRRRHHGVLPGRPRPRWPRCRTSSTPGARSRPSSG